VYLALVLVLCAVANAAGWLLQRIAVALWPIIKPNGDWLLTVVLLVAVVGLVAWASLEKA
jgi:hypothetical protein